jgi:hypothetical protein
MYFTWTTVLWYIVTKKIYMDEKKWISKKNIFGKSHFPTKKFVGGFLKLNAIMDISKLPSIKFKRLEFQGPMGPLF